MDTYEQELLIEIMKIMQMKYRHMNETLRLTKEMAEGLARDDKVTMQMLLEMRGAELEALGVCDKNINLLLEGTDEAVAGNMLSLLKGNIADDMKADLVAGNFVTIVQNTKHVLNQIIEVDKQMSCRLAGEDSFYNG